MKVLARECGTSGESFDCARGVGVVALVQSETSGEKDSIDAFSDAKRVHTLFGQRRGARLPLLPGLGQLKKFREFAFGACSREKQFGSELDAQWLRPQ